MPRPPAVPVEEKTRLVLAILAGEMSTAEAARKAKVSEQSMSTWKRLFLEGGDFNEAAAEMSERLSQMVATQAEESCQIVSRQPVRPRTEERFQKVTVNVRMRCGIGDLQKILYSLETSVPMVIADDLTIIQPRARSRARRNRNQEQSSPTALDIRFNMSGYLPGGVES